MHELFIDFKEVCVSVRTEVLYRILIEFGIPMKLFRLIKMCLNETYCQICVDKQLSDIFHVQNGLKQEDGFSPFPFNFALEYTLGKDHENSVGLNLNGTH
jgi:hypothetical protein